MLSTNARPPLSYHVIRIALGFVYFHFGILKFFPDLSPAELLAGQTIMRLTDGAINASDALFYLAIVECGLGLALIFNVFMRLSLVLFLFHMIGTFSPIFVLPEIVFKIFPFAPTIEGQYILKNVVFVVAAWGMLAPHLFARPTPESATESTPTSAVTERHQADIATPVLVPNPCEPALANFSQES